jgi:hypothetical protein
MIVNRLIRGYPDMTNLIQETTASSGARQSPDAVIRAELSEDEQLLWAGQPRQGIVFRITDVIMIPLGLAMMAAMVAPLIVMVMPHESIDRNSTDNPEFPFFLFAVVQTPFLCFALYFLLGRFVVDRRRRARTCYGVTDQRVIVIAGLLGRRTVSLNLPTLTNIALINKSDGTGTITFGPTNPMSWWHDAFPFPRFPGIRGMEPDAPTLLMINDSKHVYDLITAAQADARYPG